MMEIDSTRKGVSVDDRALLKLIYRGRPETIAELATIAHLDIPELEAALRRLATHGAISIRGNLLEYANPSVWTAAAVETESRALRTATDDATARIESLVAHLPEMLRHWSVGEASGEPVPFFTRHGPRAAEDLWLDTSTESTGRAWAILPDVARFLHGDRERTSRFAEAFAGKQEVRALLPRSAVRDPRLLAVAEHFTDAGVEFRVMDDLPSWFWIDGDLLALPFEWGEGWPTSVLGVRNSALAELGRALFFELWRRADPIGVAADPWTPLLQLMRRGITLDSASRLLGINPRTGRRRIAAAMEHYGVVTLFALGVAWATDGHRDE